MRILTNKLHRQENIAKYPHYMPDAGTWRIYCSSCYDRKSPVVEITSEITGFGKGFEVWLCEKCLCHATSLLKSNI